LPPGASTPLGVVPPPTTTNVPASLSSLGGGPSSSTSAPNPGSVVSGVGPTTGSTGASGGPTGTVPTGAATGAKPGKPQPKTLTDLTTEIGLSSKQVSSAIEATKKGRGVKTQLEKALAAGLILKVMVGDDVQMLLSVMWNTNLDPATEEINWKTNVAKQEAQNLWYVDTVTKQKMTNSKAVLNYQKKHIFITKLVEAYPDLKTSTWSSIHLAALPILEALWKETSVHARLEKLNHVYHWKIYFGAAKFDDSIMRWDSHYVPILSVVKHLDSAKKFKFPKTVEEQKKWGEGIAASKMVDTSKSSSTITVSEAAVLASSGVFSTDLIASCTAIDVVNITHCLDWKTMPEYEKENKGIPEIIKRMWVVIKLGWVIDGSQGTMPTFTAGRIKKDRDPKTRALIPHPFVDAYYNGLQALKNLIRTLNIAHGRKSSASEAHDILAKDIVVTFT
jgi:hypothetical protein